MAPAAPSTPLHDGASGSTEGVKVCEKGFPKKYAAETAAGQGTWYPEYRRPDNGRKAHVRWVTFAVDCICGHVSAIVCICMHLCASECICVLMNASEREASQEVCLLACFVTVASG